MLNLIRKLIRPSPSPGEAFVRGLGDGALFVIGATACEGIDPNGLTGDLLLAAIREALERDEQRQQVGYEPFTYATPTGERRLPFFSSQKNAERFCGEFSKERDRVFPFMVLETPGTFLGKLAAAEGPIVVLNDKSPDQRVLTPGELHIARNLWGNHG